MRYRAVGLSLVAVALGLVPAVGAWAQTTPPSTIVTTGTDRTTGEGGNDGSVITATVVTPTGGGGTVSVSPTGLHYDPDYIAPAGGDDGLAPEDGGGGGDTTGGGGEQAEPPRPIYDLTGLHIGDVPLCPVVTACYTLPTDPTTIGFDVGSPSGPPSDGSGTETPPPPSPTQIARDNAARTLAPPNIYLSPPAGAYQLVNLPTWLGVDNWEPNSATASQGGLTVTVTATPTSVTWRMGRGDPAVCYGPGSRYDTSIREENQHTDCSYTYTRSSAGLPDERYAASATLNYTVSWTASNGESGSLGTGSATTPFAVRVAEVQALVTNAT